MPFPRLRHHPSPISGTSGVSLRWCRDKCKPIPHRLLPAHPSSLSSSSPAAAVAAASTLVSSSSIHPYLLAATFPPTSTFNPKKDQKTSESPHHPLSKSSHIIPVSRLVSRVPSSSPIPNLRFSQINPLNSTLNPPPSLPFQTATSVYQLQLRQLSHHSSTSKMHYKLKDLPSLRDIPEKIEVEIEGIPDGKILLVKSGSNAVHALSPRCTHYGAPLKSGVLDGERITCPWHGACFNITTGDVEDAPALNALHKFDIVEKEDGVYVQANEADIKSGHRDPVQKCSVSSKERVLVIGGGSGTTGLLQTLRTKKYPGKITVLTKEPLPIDRPKLSKALIPDSSKIALHPRHWYAENDIDLLTAEVTSIDISSKTVTTSSGDTHTYDKLVLASGGIPRRLPLPGFGAGELKNIFTLRDVEDVRAILDGIENVQVSSGAGAEKNGRLDVVVIGSSFIGMEVGNALAKDHDVTIVGMESAPMERVMGARVGKIFQGNLEKAGIRFQLDASVEKATGANSSADGRVQAVHLKDGTVLRADIVILGVGVRPATDYIRASTTPDLLLQDGSLKTDGHFAVLDPASGVPVAGGSVFAVGDIATFPYTGPGGDGKDVRIEHWNVAQNSGRGVARAILFAQGGKSLEGLAPRFFVPIFWSALGAQMRYVGNTANGYDDVFVDGGEEGKFVAWYFKGETVVAVATMGADPVMVKVAALMRSGRMLGKKDVKAGVDVLTV